MLILGHSPTLPLPIVSKQYSIRFAFTQLRQFEQKQHKVSGKWVLTLCQSLRITIKVRFEINFTQFFLFFYFNYLSEYLLYLFIFDLTNQKNVSQYRGHPKNKQIFTSAAPLQRTRRHSNQQLVQIPWSSRKFWHAAPSSTNECLTQSLVGQASCQISVVP